MYNNFSLLDGVLLYSIDIQSTLASKGLVPKFTPSFVMTSWYCCQHNGPLNYYGVVACPQCYNRRSTCCPVVDSAYPTWPSLSTHTANNNTSSLVADSNDTTNISPIQFILASGFNTASHVNNTRSSNVSHSSRPAKPNWRWICCDCGGNNSCSLDEGCAMCQHWRCGACEMFDASVKSYAA
ncbi:hypothetical protein T440DRAFT_248357 [Plenodomus tracheiphilus IPT5]|uniref:Uncharacterized protein n=1 Tax=Plenodomus tracheiphilus IPT5 TaxID=1408161 RepID=A0A6A7AUU1_9PLEO|nr:hypothetical protein T440DRAFT_248357 [Plenodomus tracheiphilus IPT5]